MRTVGIAEGHLVGPPLRLVTTVGSHPPLGLLAPAAVLSFGENPLQADHLARLASLSIAMTLLVAAAMALFVPAVGSAGSLMFPADAHWSQGLGWFRWGALAGCGAALIVATSVGSLRPRESLRGSQPRGRARRA